MDAPEYGITLAGPDPRALVREVSADALRSKLRDDPPRPGSVEATIAFAECAKEQAASSPP